MRSSCAGEWIGLTVGAALLGVCVFPVAIIGPRAFVAGLADMPSDPEIPGGRATIYLAMGFVLCVLGCACALIAWSATRLWRRRRPAHSAG